MAPADEAAHDEVRDVLARLTAAWRAGRADELRGLLHEDVVFVSPSFGQRAEGRDACAATYQDFVTNAKILEYAESGLRIDAWGDTAVATYHYEMEWETEGRRHRDAGHDVITLTRADGRWWIVWRTLISSAA